MGSSYVYGIQAYNMYAKRCDCTVDMPRQAHRHQPQPINQSLPICPSISVRLRYRLVCLVCLSVCLCFLYFLFTRLPGSRCSLHPMQTLKQSALRDQALSAGVPPAQPGQHLHRRRQTGPLEICLPVSAAAATAAATATARIGGRRHRRRRRRRPWTSCLEVWRN